MEDETKFLLDSQRRQLEDAAAERVEQRANQAMQYHTEAASIAAERRKSYLDHSSSLEKLRDNHVVKVEQLNEAANAEKSRVSQQKADLEKTAYSGCSENKVTQKEKILNQLKSSIEEIHNISRDHQSSLSALQAQGILEESQERERHNSVIQQLLRDAEEQKSDVEEAAAELPEIDAAEEKATKAEVKQALDEMHEKHFAYIAKIEEMLSERERQLEIARNEQIAQQEMLHKKREQELEKSLLDFAEREKSIANQVEKFRGKQKP